MTDGPEVFSVDDGVDITDQYLTDVTAADSLGVADQGRLPDPKPGFRSGFVCSVGRPNAGKSTLMNALVGEKIAIASDKPQTTRHLIRGVINRADAQIVVIDTPGVHRPRTLLGERLNALVYDTWSEVDLIGLCFPADQRVGPGDRHLIEAVAGLGGQRQVIALATKIDKVSKNRLREHLMAIQAAAGEAGIEFAEIIPVSALTGEQVDLTRDLIASLLPEGPAYYPDAEITDEPTETLVAELIREAALGEVNDELPHSVAVTVEEMSMRSGRDKDHPLLDIYASIVVERDSQKPILIGRKGERIKTIGQAARTRVSHLLGTPVYLDLRVKVMREWQRDAKYLNRLGF
jgi:GTP-binding protein Era